MCRFRWDRLAVLVIDLMAIICCVWFFMSWADVAMHNTDQVPVYAEWNVFDQLFG